MSDQHILEAHGVVKRFHSGIWPMRRTRTVLAGADLLIDRGELKQIRFTACNACAGLQTFIGPPDAAHPCVTSSTR